MSKHTPYDNLEGLSIGEGWILAWQYNWPMGGFWVALTNAMVLADGDNLDLLAKAWPEHVQCLRNFRTGYKWWPNLREKAIGHGYVKKGCD